jgi:hypothetical protein
MNFILKIISQLMLNIIFNRKFFKSKLNLTGKIKIYINPVASISTSQ